MIQHCRNTFHSRTKENRLVIQIQKALWRKLRPLFSRNKKLYASKEVKENALSAEGNSCWPKTKTAVNRCVPWPLSVKQGAEITFAQWKCPPRRRKNLWEQAAFWHEVKVAINTRRCNSCRRWKRCCSLCTCLRSFKFWSSRDSVYTFRIPSSPIAGAC